MMKHIFKSILIVLFLFISSNAIAQTGYEDVVYLKNGTIVHGMIIEQIPNQSVKIQTKDKNVFVFKMDEIDKITKEKKAGKEKPEPEPKNYSDGYTGYSLSIESQIGPGLGNGKGGDMTFNTHIINGAMIQGMFSIGGGIGFDIVKTHFNYNSNNNYYSDYSSYLLATYYIDLRAFPMKGKISPLIILDYGYSGAIFSSYISGGPMFNTGLGGKFKFNHKMGLDMSINYRMQRVNLYDNYNYPPTTEEESKKLEFLCISFGFTF